MKYFLVKPVLTLFFCLQGLVRSRFLNIKNGLFLKPLFIIFLSFLPFISYAQSSGDIVLISDGNSNFLSADVNNTSAVANLTTPTEYSLWEYLTDGSGGYMFRNVATNTYLYRSGGRTDSYLSLNSNYTVWAENDNKFFYYYYSFPYFNYYTFSLNSNSWGLQYTWSIPTKISWGTSISFTVMTKSITLSSNPESLHYAASGGTQTATITMNSVYRSADSKYSISCTKAALSASFSNSYNGHFTSSISGNIINITAGDNTGQTPKSSSITVTTDQGGTAFIQLTQEAGFAFTHQSGHSGRALLTNGMQGVHTERIKIYASAGETISLEVPNKNFSYSRWYQFDTDANVTTGSLSLTGYTDVYGGKGYFKTSGSVSTPTFTHNSSLTSGLITEIACDMSYYVDYKFVGPYLQQEPTLSQRVIFEIYPAQEIATALTQHANSDRSEAGSYLENYEIVAPMGRTIYIGPQYAYSGSSSNYYTSNSLLSTGSWYQNGTAFTTSQVLNNRVIALPAATDAHTDVYTLISGGYGIAKFTITYKDVNEVGPSTNAIVSDQILSSNYNYVIGYHFDDNSTAPLAWNESGYGFYYPDWGNDATYRTGSSLLASQGEYALMNEVPSSGYSFLEAGVRDMLYQRSGATTGHFLYVNSSANNGVIANLNFNNGGLCPGSNLYVSAWVNNLGSNTDAALNFNLVGIDNSGKETVVSTYTTGHLSGSRGTWHQVFFEVQMSQVEYADYKLRIENSGLNTADNYYAIDDVCVYMQKPMVKAYQSGVICATTDTAKLVMLRLNTEALDYSTSVNGLLTLYYQFQDMMGNPLNLSTEYLNGTSSYGSVVVSATKDNYSLYLPTIVNGEVTYTGLQKYQDAINSGVTVPQAFYTQEYNENGELENILYIYHHSNAFAKGSTYSCAIALDPTVFGSDGQCDFLSSFTIQPNVKLVLNNTICDSLSIDGMCANRFNTIGLLFYGIKSGLVAMEQGSCKSDWLEGREEEYVVGGKYEGYDFAAIKDALRAFRQAYPTATSVADVAITANFTELQKTVLEQTVSRGLLELYKDKIERRALIGTHYYTAFPIQSSGTNTEGDSLLLCDDAVVVKLTATGHTAIALGYKDEVGVPADVLTSRAIRMSEEQANAIMLELPVVLTNITNDQLHNGSVYLLSTTTDPNADPIDNNTNANKAFSTLTVATQVSGQVIMSLSSRHSGLVFKQGHKYDFLVSLPTTDADGCQMSGRFSIIVVPEMVVWNPTTGSHSWHVDRNWSVIDAKGNIQNSVNGYVPSDQTNVVINANIDIPVLVASTLATAACSAETLNDGAQKNIEWDLNFKANTCKNIHIGAKAKLAGQDQLKYEKAWVDLELSTAGWNLVAPPFEDMVVGDMYIPSGGDKTGYFEEVASPDSRYAYEVFTSLYKSSAYDVDRNNQSTIVESAEWTQPFNALNAPVVSAHGYSLRIKNNTNTDTTVVVRLPKRDTRYYYYGTYGEQTSLFEDITRTDAGHRLVGTNGTGENVAVFDAQGLVNSNKLTHLMANPYMVELDMTKFMTDDYNASSVRSIYYVMDKNRVQTTIDMEHSITSGGKLDGPFEIAPNTSFMVALDPSNTQPKLRIIPSMCKSYTTTSSQIAPTAAIKEDNRSILTIKGERNGFVSSCVVLMLEGANAGLDDQDSHLLIMNPNQTPSSIYTNVENTALSINITSDINMTPIGYAVLNDTITDSLYVTFTGITTFANNLFLFDALTNTSTPLTEGIRLSLPHLPESDTRYYICSQSEEETSVKENPINSNLKVYQPNAYEVIVASIETMQVIRIYGVSGQIIMERSKINSTLESFTLPTGVYIIEVECGNNVYHQKVVVR